MKVAFIVSFFDFRNDVRRVISEVMQRHEVVIFGRKEELDNIKAHLPSGAALRVIDEEVPNANNRHWARWFYFFRKLPESKENFYLMELFKASNIPDKRNRRIVMLYYFLLKFTPKFFSYDSYLDRIQFSGNTRIDDIDQFICFTEISHDAFFKRLLSTDKVVKVYVYSWDHPCKHTRFSKRAQYLCWSNGIKEDLVELQAIPAEQIKVIGASQFSYIYDFLQKPKHSLTRHYSDPYIYFGCALGIEELVPQELKIIKTLSRQIADIIPEMKLVVRPYPVLKNWSYYEALSKEENIILDDSFRKKDRSVADQQIVEKFEKIHFAEAFMHLGTTMGLEACFTDTPSFIIDFGYKKKKGLGLNNFIHQYQNVKYLIDNASENHIATLDEFKGVIQDLQRESLLDLNKKVKNEYMLKSTEQLATEIVSVDED